MMSIAATGPRTSMKPSVIKVKIRTGACKRGWDIGVAPFEASNRAGGPALHCCRSKRRRAGDDRREAAAGVDRRVFHLILHRRQGRSHDPPLIPAALSAAELGRAQ